MPHRSTSFLCTLSLSLLVSSTSLSAPLTVPGLFFQGDNFSGAERGFGSEIQESWGVALPGVEGQTYSWPAPADHPLPAGMNIVRLPFEWERLQPTLNQDFDAGYLAKLHATAGAWRDKGANVLLDVHNYAYYKLNGRGTAAKGQLIGSTDVPIAAFTDLWRRLALEFGSTSTSSPFIFGLMNEPHDLTVATWVQAAQAAVNAIRAAGANNVIFVPGADWTTATDFSWSDNSKLLQSVTDPGNNFAIEVHQYYDGTCTPTGYADKLKPFEDWAVANQRVAFLGEFNVTDATPACHEALANFLAHLHSRAAGTPNGVWVGHTYWEGANISDALPELSPTLPTTCTNGTKDGLETDVDCGATCLRCAAQKSCAHDYDCQSGFCAGGVCGTASAGGAGGAGNTGGAAGAASTTGGVASTAAGAGGTAVAGSSSIPTAGGSAGGSANGGAGGASGSLSTAGTVSASGQPSPTSEQSGCSCRTATRGDKSGTLASLAALGLLVFWSRRRKTR